MDEGAKMGGHGLTQGPPLGGGGGGPRGGGGGAGGGGGGGRAPGRVWASLYGSGGDIAVSL